MPSTDLVRATRLGDLARRPPRWRAALRVAMLAGFLSALLSSPRNWPATMSTSRSASERPTRS
ncbi:MAG TPA: hypothetical protein VF256_04735 [Streptosporangiaceae bacterium]